MIITISGPPGSGKTTVAEKLAEECNLFLISSGKLFRDMASKRGLSLEDFGQYANKNENVDRELDGEIMKEILKHYEKMDLVVEGRLAGHMVNRKKLKAFKVWVDAPLDIRSIRISKRDRKSQEIAKRNITEREKCEKSRYKSIYGIDLNSLKVYDLIIDSQDIMPDKIVRMIRIKAGI